ncbi:MAG: multiheme c-type cytochrome [Desulfobulbales bacterium]|nr:multiheme c-type cytochrome [Desulfobulbales bacterium]
MKRIILLQTVVLLILFIAGYSLAGTRETFERHFMLSPWSIAKGETSACIQCHTSDNMDPEMHAIVREWKDSWHAKNNISCHDCHGGAPEDASMSMMHQRGFKGTPEDIDIPEFCGTCHIAILGNYLNSGHGKTFNDTAEGPSCVSCHGSHDIQQASMDIINEKLCSQCHTYDRAKEMKQALFFVENKLSNVRENLGRLQLAGIDVGDQEKSFFRTHAEFRALFHSIDVEAVRLKSSDYTKQLEVIEGDISRAFEQLAFRRNFSAYLFLIFIGLSIVVFLLSKSYESK